MILRLNVLIVSKNKITPIHILHRQEERKHLKATGKMKSYANVMNYYFYVMCPVS